MELNEVEDKGRTTTNAINIQVGTLRQSLIVTALCKGARHAHRGPWKGSEGDREKAERPERRRQKETWARPACLAFLPGCPACMSCQHSFVPSFLSPVLLPYLPPVIPSSLPPFLFSSLPIFLPSSLLPSFLRPSVYIYKERELHAWPTLAACVWIDPPTNA